MLSNSGLLQINLYNEIPRELPTTEKRNVIWAQVTKRGDWIHRPNSHIYFSFSIRLPPTQAALNKLQHASLGTMPPFQGKSSLFLFLLISKHAQTTPNPLLPTPILVHTGNMLWPVVQHFVTSPLKLSSALIEELCKNGLNLVSRLSTQCFFIA